VTEFEEICLPARAEDGKWRSSRCDMLRKTVPEPYSGDWKSSVAVGWESGYGEQTVRETMRNADTFETQTLLDDELRQW